MDSTLVGNPSIGSEILEVKLMPSTVDVSVFPQGNIGTILLWEAVQLEGVYVSSGLIEECWFNTAAAINVLQWAQENFSGLWWSCYEWRHLDRPCLLLHQHLGRAIGITGMGCDTFTEAVRCYCMKLSSVELGSAGSRDMREGVGI